jgi:branched-chain amino acid transport system permease protein
MQDYLANLTPQYWQFWIGLVLVIIVLVGRERMTNWTAPVRAFLAWLGPRAAHPVETARVSTVDER